MCRSAGEAGGGGSCWKDSSSSPRLVVLLASVNKLPGRSAAAHRPLRGWWVGRGDSHPCGRGSRFNFIRSFSS